MDQTTCYVLGALFAATLVRSTFGFGEALVAVPLLAFCVPITVAVPLAALISIVVAGVVVAQDWRQIHVRSAGWLVGATVVGMPIGLWVLKNLNERLVKSALAVLIASFSSFCLFAKSPPHLKEDRRRYLLLAGFLAGILGGAYGVNGPPLVVYGSLRRWSPQHLRATLQAYFLPASLIGMAGFASAGLLTGAVTRYFLLSLPATVVAIVVGRAINRRLHGHSFFRYVHVGLILIAIMLVIRTSAK